MDLWVFRGNEEKHKRETGLRQAISPLHATQATMSAVMQRTTSRCEFNTTAASGDRQYKLMRHINRMYEVMFEDKNGAWYEKPDALAIIYKVTDALQMMIASMNEELVEMNAKMGRTSSGKAKKKGGIQYIDAEAEEGDEDENDGDWDCPSCGDLEEQDPIAYAALAAVRADDKKKDEAAAEKAMKCADKKLNMLDKATVMVKSKAALRDLSNGGNGEYPAAIDMRIDKELFDRFNTCMVPSKWPGDGEKTHHTFFVDTLNMYEELLVRMEKYIEHMEKAASTAVNNDDVVPPSPKRSKQELQDEAMAELDDLAPTLEHFMGELNKANAMIKATVDAMEAGGTDGMNPKPDPQDMFEPKPKALSDVPAVDLVCHETMCASPVPKTPGGSKSPSPDLGSKRTRSRVQRVVWDESDESDEPGAMSD